jgi:uncharacterized protein YlxW (UPF0749 family)
LLDRERLRIPRPQQAAILLITAVLGFLFAVQVRSQASAEKYLSGQDDVTLGLLIDGLSKANNRLVLARIDLAGQESRLSADIASHNATAPALQDELTRLRIVNGSVPVHGPGIQLTISYKLQAFELQDLGNVFRSLGAEALEINGHRITARTVIEDKGGQVRIDGSPVGAPYKVLAVGDVSVLAGRDVQSVVETLSQRGTVGLVQLAEVKISSTRPQQPVVYSSFAP